ncbi:MAG TPA: branched-chain amino acid dehydrogenase [Elusimicrobia bacterium]|nr:MAG: branched-chain amino acid dehydrogenase [Elusimicrobia bacterium GWA2_64_40]HAN05819.1 branched-chain amino acid dehydrogenase [Elusimicrobiota bacterium]HAU89309.1 branched-chain amino acid dehydrogenase [Elusimicrobiota bacterium]
MKPILTADEAVKDIKDGASLMVAGFMGCGNAFTLIDALINKGTKELNLITSDTSFPEVGVGRIICQNRAATLTASHIGTNPVSGQKMNSGELKVTLVPQGTFAERIRAKGAGLGGVLTPTGRGTAVEEGKQKLTIDGKEFLLEKPLGADFAFIKAEVADTYGNAFLPGATKNMAVVMAMAADHVILEAERIVQPGELDPERVTIPGIFVSAIVKATLPASNLQLKA